MIASRDIKMLLITLKSLSNQALNKTIDHSRIPTMLKRDNETPTTQSL